MMLTELITDIDNVILYDDCIATEEKIAKDFAKAKSYKDKSKDHEKSKKTKEMPLNNLVSQDGLKPSEFTCDSISANMFLHYNIFDDKAKDGFFQLREKAISNFINWFNPASGTYYIEAWITILRDGESMGTHYHRLIGDKSWHGYYCVNTEHSQPDYSTEVYDGQVIENKNGLFAMEETNGKYHGHSVWNEADKARVTISFDIFTFQTEKGFAFNV